MTEIPTAQYPLGIEQDDGHLKGALLTRRGNKPKILRLFTLSLEEKDATPNHLSFLHTVDPPLPRDPLRRALIVTGTSTLQTLIRTLDIKLTKEKDIDAVLAFQSEPLIPYPIDQAVLDKAILNTDENGSQLSVFAVRKDHLQQHLDFYNYLNIEPESVQCYPSALAIFSKEYTDVQEPLFIVHLSPKEIGVLLVDDGKVLAGHAVNYGVNELVTAITTHELQADSLDFNAIATGPQSPLRPYIERLKIELQRTIFALTKQARRQEITIALMTGDGAAVGNLAQYLCDTLQKTLIIPIAPSDPDISTSDLQKFAVPIGLALGGLDGTRSAINFLQAEFAYPHPWKRLKRPLAAYILCSVLITFMIFLLGKESRSYALNDARARYKTVLATLGVDHSAFEKKAFGTTEENIIPLDLLSLDDIGTRLDWIETDIQNTPYLFPLKPNTPRVSDFLAWISSNPKASTIDPKTNEHIALIQIENFTYTMVKRPEKAKQRERYQVKIDLDFASKEPNWAREFYDMLMAPNDFIDPKGEVKWSAAQGRYRVSFFLKDRTYYP